MKLFRIVAFGLLFFLLFSVLPTTELSAFADEMPYRIDCDLTNQIVTIYSTSDDTIVRQMLCSSGANRATPTGTFTLPQNKYGTERKEWYYFPAFGCYAKYATRIYQGILFHSIPYNRKDDTRISQKAVDEFGAPASHGCLRLRWEDAKFIALNCLAGTKVHIYYGEETDEELRALLMESSYSNEFGMTYTEFLGIPNDPNVLGRFSSGEEVTNLQYRLRALGFFNGEVNGEYRSSTVTAVKQMQEKLNLEPNGYATTALLEAIYSPDAPTSTNVEISDGMSGPCVKNLQTNLQTLHLYSGEIDGIYDLDVIEAVNRFKRVYGYTDDGIVTPEVQKAIAYETENLTAHFESATFELGQNAETLPMASVSARKRVRIREEASTDSYSLEKVSNGDMVVVLEQGDKWSKIRHGSTIGYMMNDYLEFTEQEMAMLTYTSGDQVYTIGTSRQDYLDGAPLPAAHFAEYLASLESNTLPFEELEPLTENVAIVNTRAEGVQLNLRAEPSPDGEVIAMLDNGTQLDVLLKSTVWTLVSYGSESGYLMNEYLEFTSAKSSSEEISAEESGSDFFEQPAGTIHATVYIDANVYNIDSEDANVIDTLPKDARVKIIHADDDWSQVEYDGKQGYMHNEDLTFILTEDYI